MVEVEPAFGGSARIARELGALALIAMAIFATVSLLSLHLARDKATLYLDVGGASLHERGWRAKAFLGRPGLNGQKAGRDD